MRGMGGQVRVRKPKPPAEDKRPWAVVDSMDERLPILTWHKQNAKHLTEMLLRPGDPPNRYKIVDRTKAAK